MLILAPLLPHPQFRHVFQSLLNHVSVDLSAFYLDTAKDRLYIQDTDSLSRRACQTVQATLLKVRRWHVCVCVGWGGGAGLGGGEA